MQSRLRGCKYIWQLPQTDQHALLQLASSYNISLPIAQTLMTRGLDTKQEVDDFLFTSYEKNVADPATMKDALKAVDRILKAIRDKEKILISGDYDVDGITSSALMLMCLLPLGADINFFLPNRVRDGYGLSAKVVERAVKNGYTLIITVDNGITAFEPARVARAHGIDLIITDHHRQHDEVPDAYAVVNPNQNACPYPFKTLAGVGVIFKVMSLLYQQKGLPLPDKVYELLLLGTVADVVPLVGENRYWVRHGLQYINRVESLALKVLKSNSKLAKPKLTSLDIGFSITPQINALGRLEDARQGVKFLIGDDSATVEEVGKVLLALNDARKMLERSIFTQVEHEIKSGAIDISSERIIVAASDNWPSGVIGLVASRLVGAYGRPTLLFHLTKDGIAKGSCRSIPAFNMFEALKQNEDLITQFGGHTLAAGLSLPIQNIPRLKERLETLAAAQLTDDDLQKKLALDAHLLLFDANKKLMSDMEYLEPFGNANNQPLFYVHEAALVERPTLLKDAHVRARIFADGIIKPVIFFNSPELYPLLIAQEHKPFSLAVQVVENHWQGKVSVELQGIDIAGIDT